jgi:hypothetical protein
MYDDGLNTAAPRVLNATEVGIVEAIVRARNHLTWGVQQLLDAPKLEPSPITFAALEAREAAVDAALHATDRMHAFLDAIYGIADLERFSEEVTP